MRVQLLSRVEPAAEPPVAVTLAQAVLKGDKMDDVVRDAVMLGVAAIQPLVTKRTETTVAALMRGARLDRWRRVALASVKQSRRAVLPEIRTPLTLETYLDEPQPAAQPDARRAGRRRDVQNAQRSCETGPRRPTPPSGRARRRVGRGRMAAARAQASALVTLGHRTLRADAVPVAAISVLQFLWEHP